MRVIVEWRKINKKRMGKGRKRRKKHILLFIHVFFDIVFWFSLYYDFLLLFSPYLNQVAQDRLILELKRIFSLLLNCGWPTGWIDYWDNCQLKGEGVITAKIFIGKIGDEWYTYTESMAYGMGFWGLEPRETKNQKLR